MPYLLRIVGEEVRIEEIRRLLTADGIPVSEVNRVGPDSKQLSTPWASPEVLEALKFITAALQASGAAVNLLIAVRSLLKDGDKILIENKENSAELTLDNTTPDERIAAFAKQVDTSRRV